MFDHTKLFRSITCDLDIIQLQADADKFFECSKTWLLNINNSKCKCMRIGISSVRVASHNYVIDDEPFCSTIDLEL